MRVWKALWLSFPALVLSIPLPAAAAQDANVDSFSKYKEQLLHAPDPEGKAIAAHWILNNPKADPSESLEFLRNILRDASPHESVIARTRAVLRAFSDAGNYAAIEEMLLLVSDARESVREAAVRAFKDMPDRGGRLSAEIIRVIGSPLSPEKIRRAGIVASGALRIMAAIEPLATMLSNAKFAEAARGALYEITRKRFQDKEAFDAWWSLRKNWTREQFLDDVLNDFEGENLEVKKKWMQGDLSRHLESLSDPHPQIRRIATEGISSFRRDSTIGKAIDPLCQQFGKESEGSVREAILKTLGEIGSPGNARVRDLLIGALDSNEPRERRAGVRALGAFTSDPAVLPTLAHIVRQWVYNQRSDEVEFRIELFQTLARASEPEGVPSDLGENLGICLINYPTPDVRKHAALAMGAHGTERSIGDLASVLSVHQEPDQNVRFNAAIALKQIGQRIKDAGKVLPSLHTFLGDPAFQNRKLAIDLLGELRDVRSGEPLLRRLGVETDQVLRHGIFAAMGNVGDSSLLDPLLKMELREGDSRDAYFQTLEKLCGKDVFRLQRTAQELLTRGEPGRSVGLFEKALGQEAIDAALALEIRRQLVPAYRAAAREAAMRPNAPENAGLDSLSKAKDALVRLRQLEPEQLAWVLGFAEVQVELGQKDEAIASYRELLPRLEKWAGSDVALLRRGLDPLAGLLLEKKDLAAAILVLARVVEVSPGERPPLEKLALVRVEAKQFREAMADFERLLSIASREDKEDWWRAVAGLCALRVEYSHAGGVWDYLRELPGAGEISAPLAARLASLREEARAWIEFIGPLLPPPIPYDPGAPKKSE